MDRFLFEYIIFRVRVPIKEHIEYILFLMFIIEATLKMFPWLSVLKKDQKGKQCYWCTIKPVSKVVQDVFGGGGSVFGDNVSSRPPLPISTHRLQSTLNPFNESCNLWDKPLVIDLFFTCLTNVLRWNWNKFFYLSAHTKKVCIAIYLDEGKHGTHVEYVNCQGTLLVINVHTTAWRWGSD